MKVRVNAEIKGRKRGRKLIRRILIGCELNKQLQIINWLLANHQKIASEIFFELLIMD